MRAVKDFLSSSSDAMIDYILVVSSPDDHHQDPVSTQSKESREKAVILNALHHRMVTSPLLHREAIPVLPHLLDVPKHLAVMTSVVVRHSRRQGYPKRSNNPNDVPFDELCSRCLEVEEQALFRVSQLASKLRRHEGHGSPHDSSSLISPTLPTPPPPAAASSSQSSPTSATARERKISLPGAGKIRKSRKSGRPSTAPSPGDSDGPSAGNQTDISMPPSPTFTNTGGLTRVFTRASISSSSRHSGQVPESISATMMEETTIVRSPLEGQEDPSSATVPTPPRPAYLHHPRSTSTDSALLNKNVPSLMSSHSSSSFSQSVSTDNTDETGKKRKGLLRGILVRR